MRNDKRCSDKVSTFYVEFVIKLGICLVPNLFCNSFSLSYYLFIIIKWYVSLCRCRRVKFLKWGIHWLLYIWPVQLQLKIVLRMIPLVLLNRLEFYISILSLPHICFYVSVRIQRTQVLCLVRTYLIARSIVNRVILKISSIMAYYF